MTTPYAQATNNPRAREETRKFLLRFGCQSISFIDDGDDVLLAFEHCGQNFQIRVSAKEWAAMWLKKNPWNRTRRSTREEWEQKALRQGLNSVNSVLRDWIRGQLTAIRAGMLSFEVAFMPYTLTANGRTMAERIAELKLLPSDGPKVVQLPGNAA